MPVFLCNQGEHASAARFKNRGIITLMNAKEGQRKHLLCGHFSKCQKVKLLFARNTRYRTVIPSSTKKL